MAHVPKRYRWKVVHITYGVSEIDCTSVSKSEIPSHMVGMRDVSDGEYWLIVARLEPENNIHHIIRGYLSSRSSRPLVIVGDSSSSQYKEVLVDLAAKAGQGKKVILTGSVYDRQLLARLRCGCLAYIHGHSVGGTNPSLLEAMSAGNLVIAHDNPFNRDVCSETALYFSDESSLTKSIDRIDGDPHSFRGLGERARARAKENHRWDDVVSAHERLFSEIRSG